MQRFKDLKPICWGGVHSCTHCARFWGLQVHGYRGNQFKGFDCRTEAERYMMSEGSSTMLLIKSENPKTSSRKVKSPTLVKVKRTRSTSPRPGQRPSTTAEVCNHIFEFKHNVSFHVCTWTLHECTCFWVDCNWTRLDSIGMIVILTGSVWMIQSTYRVDCNTNRFSMAEFKWYRRW